MKGICVLATAVTLASPAARAADFAAKGAAATLTVEYVYESAGKTADKYDAHEWKVKRSAKVTADLTALPPEAYSGMHAMSAEQQADLAKKQTSAKSAQKKLEPMAADMEKIAAKCGDDEACIEREVKKYGFGMSDADQEKAKSAGKDIAEVGKQGPARYQLWKGASQNGTYTIEETAHFVDADPICESLPKQRCTKDETRKANGAIPASGTGAMFEMDGKDKTLEVLLPGPFPLAYSQTVTTNKPGEKGGTSQGVVRFPSAAPRPMKIAIKGDWKNQSGTETTKVQGAGGEGGTLTVRWQLTVK